MEQYQTIEQLTASIAELEKENARLVSAIDERMVVSHIGVFNRGDDPKVALNKIACYEQGLGEYFGKEFKKQLAASQAYAEQLREALKRIGYDEACFEASENPSEWPVNVALEDLSIPNDTSALDAYVAEKVKEIIESHAPEGRNVTNAQHVEMRHKFVEQIATLTRQRDLAVEALEKYGRHDRNCEAVTEAVSECCGCGFNEALSTIKGSEAMAQGDEK